MDNTVEETVAEAWCDILGTADVHLDDDFFACGGDSMLAMMLLAQVERELDVELSLEGLFVDGSFGALLAACGRASRPKGADECRLPDAGFSR
ncbi:phosphopantetheine-binding protein [Micromonospora sagamiensis]|uniref:Phosphopantetheine binding protein n=1 Tax=Micromonospora sagamiensis TaxID=47875 RepID=A0A562WJF7_9ACTN|nr:phosphopantetheine-binding protein [Micromonospora sagamiensis]TWJ30302.1 phosphopantetheine binding protein [Micromonospora sagamiensis]BCL16668.1 hypothetical protein GCM10017556_44070 [Micromonospora sagamiensis]